MSLDVALGGERLHGLDNFKVRDVQVVVLGRVVVLLGDQHTLCNSRSDHQKSTANLEAQHTLEEVFVDDAPVLLGNEHAGRPVVVGGLLLNAPSPN